MDSNEFEQELEDQLQQQTEALQGVEVLLQGEQSEELIQMKEELLQAISEVKAALLEVKKSKLLASISAASHQPAAGSPGDVNASKVSPGEQCIFRFSDGNWYHGRVESCSEATASICFQHPIRGFMLQCCHVPLELVKPGKQPIHVAAADLQIGITVYALHPLSRLYTQAEVAAPARLHADPSVTFLDEGITRSVPVSDIILSPHARLSDDDDLSSSDDGDDSDDNSWSADLDDDGDDADDGSDDAQDGEDHVGLGAAWDPFAHAREAAAAGRHTDTAHFADWEVHSRGIASKLLAGMGYVKGQGLGRSGQGIQEPVLVSLRPSRRGLGDAAAEAAASGKKRRKRGGHRARVKKHMKQQQDVKQAKAEQQHQLEVATGSSGLFAFINHHLGSGSDAAAVRRATEGPVTAGAAALAPPSRKAAADQPASRRDLVAVQEKITAAEAKVLKLKEMFKRNAKDQVLAPQIQAQLQQASQQLQDALSQHANATKSQSDKDAQRKWLKF